MGDLMAITFAENSVADTSEKTGGKLLLPETSVRQAYEEYKHLYDLSKMFFETRDISSILDRFLESFSQITAYSAAALYLNNREGKLFLAEKRHYSDAVARKLDAYENDGYLSWAIQNDRVTLLPDEESENAGSLLIPLILNQTPLGILVVFIQQGEGSLSTRRLDQITLLATQGAMAIENAKLFRDLQAQNKAIRRISDFLGNVLENVADPVISLDARGKITMWNAAAEELFQHRAKDVLGKTVGAVLTGALLESCEEALERSLLGAAYQREELFYRTPDGKERPLRLHASPMRSEKGEVSGTIISIYDRSESQELMNLKKVDQLKDEFLSSISHELRTPLTGIQSSTEILLSFADEEPETRREFLSIIQAQGHRLMRIVDNILFFTEMSRGNEPFSLEAVEIMPVVTEALEMFQEPIREKQIEVENRLNGSPIWVLAESRRLKQVFVNLLDNALKFTHEGGKICLAAEQETRAGGVVKISVCDTGVGIPENARQVVFEKFKQLGNTLTSKPDGTGLGLTIVKDIVGKMNGSIWVESREPQGTAVHFTLKEAEKN